MNRRMSNDQSMSAFGGKADMTLILSRRPCNQSVVMFLVVSMPQREGSIDGKGAMSRLSFSAYFSHGGPSLNNQSRRSQ